MSNWLVSVFRQLFENLKKVPSSFKSNIFCADHENMELISKYNKGFCFLICLINVYSKYVWVVHLKNKRGITTTVTIAVTVTITNLFQTNLDESNHRPNKIWIYKCRRFYNRSIKSWLQDDDIKIYSTHNEGKSVVTVGFIRN